MGTRRTARGGGPAVQPKPHEAAASVDPVKLRAYLNSQVPLSRIATSMGMSVVDLRAAIKTDVRLARIQETAEAEGLNALSVAMMATARKGNPQVLIFLAKNWLGMTDKVETHNTNLTTLVEVPTPMTVEDWEASAAAMQEASRRRRAADVLTAQASSVAPTEE